MRLVAGSNPAVRTTNHQPIKGATMGYHDRPPPDYMKTGISVVNPLIRIERKLKEVQEILDNISDASVLTANDLKIKIQRVLDD